MTLPRLLEVVDGHRLIAYTHQRDAGNGSRAYGVGLFAAPQEPAHAFVVWTLIRTEDGSWLVERGDYCFSLLDACDAYAARGGSMQR